ncbi:MAG: IMP dehydrogenase [bacterium]|nr:IMP dehydrogenase [bacterium]
MKIPLGLTFDDCLLEPRKSAILRSGVATETKLTKKITLKIPVISSAMDTVTGPEMAIALGRLGGLGVLHRNCTIEQEVTMLKAVKKQKVMAAAAVGAVDLERAIALDKAGADVIIIDTAHAHVAAIIKNARLIKKKIKAQLIVGNVATSDAARDLVGFADAIKVGVGPGSICTTRIVAGVGVPQLTAIMNVVKVAQKFRVPVIADGGIKYSGDIVKALAAGASCVMLGSMLAGTDEAPGKLISKGGQKFKEYRGMGSLGAMQSNQSSDRYFQKGAKRFVPEGVEAIIPYKGPLEEIIYQLVGGLRSGMGYIGTATIEQMWQKARFVQITNAGLKESHQLTVTISIKAPNY